jgi:hypothetical protein
MGEAVGPADEREIVRHYTLSRDELDLIAGKRSGHSRLGFAVLLCYLRHSGRVLEANEIPPPELLSFMPISSPWMPVCSPSTGAGSSLAVSSLIQPRQPKATHRCRVLLR